MKLPPGAFKMKRYCDSRKKGPSIIHGLENRQNFVPHCPGQRNIVSVNLSNLMCCEANITCEVVYFCLPLLFVIIG